MSVSYPNLPVKMFGFLPGITTPGGVTHQAIEDISVMRSLPNMTILDCGDATDVESVLDVAYFANGPVYIRMLRGEIPRLFDKNEPMKLGVNRTLSQGSDLVILSCGICTEEAMRAIPLLQKKGLSIQHIHVSTLKPFSGKPILDLIARSKYGVITMENHSVTGGLGSIMAEEIAEAGLGKKLYKIGIHGYAHGANKAYLMKEYKIDAMALVEKIEEITKTSFNIQEEDLKKVYIEPVHTISKAEAL